MSALAVPQQTPLSPTSSVRQVQSQMPYAFFNPILQTLVISVYAYFNFNSFSQL